MEPDEAFGPAEQTPAQRQALLDEAQALGAALGLPPLSPSGQRLYQRYVAGELSLAQCSAYLRQRDDPAQPPRSSSQGPARQGIAEKAHV